MLMLPVAAQGDLNRLTEESGGGEVESHKKRFVS